MALLFMDGFEQYAAGTVGGNSLNSSYYQTNGLPSCYWHSISSANIINIETGTYRTAQPVGASCSISSSFGSAYYAALKIPNMTDIYCGFFIRMSAMTGNIFSLPGAPATAPTTGLVLEVSAAGALLVKNASTAAVYMTTASNTINAGIWAHVEFFASFSASGSIEVRVDGTSVGTVNTVDTRGGIAGAGFPYLLLHRGSGTSNYHDDLYVCDSTGATNNSFLGPTHVYTLMPTSNGTTNNFTAVGAASNYMCVDENTPNTSDYVRANTVNQVDLYNVADLAVTPVSVYGVMVGNTSKKNDNGPRLMRNKLNVGPTTVNGATSTPIYNDYRIAQNMFETQPNGTAWDLTAVNAMQIGIETQ